MLDPLVLANVIRDVLDPFRQTVPLRVYYTNRLLLNGTELRPSAIVNRPKVEFGSNDLRVFYTLILVDPDAPSPSNPNLREYLHWMVTDIPGSTDVSFGQEVIFYEKPEPRSGIHRMVFVLFRQLGRAQCSRLTCATTSTAGILPVSTILILSVPCISIARGSLGQVAGDSWTDELDYNGYISSKKHT